MAYRSIAIRAGESVQLRVLHFQDTCFEESIPCRRISVDAHADESITLEVEPAHPEDAFGILATNVGFSLPQLETRLTVRGGAVWIVRTAGDMAGTGMVTVTARR
jgi:hypothetical protein